MMKFLNLADIHSGIKRYGKLNLTTGIHSRVEDTFRSLKDAVSFAFKESVDFIVILGDIFDTKTPSNIEREMLIDTLYPLFNQFTTYIIPGNHDTESLSHALASMKHLGFNNKLYIIDEPTIIEKYEHPLVFIPWTKEQSISKYITNFNIPNSILFSHFTVSNAVFSNNFTPELGEETIPISLLEDKFLAGYIGHIHKRQELSNKKPIMYVGSLVKTNFGEINDPDKGIVLTTIENKKVTNKFISIYDRPFIEVDLNKTTISEGTKYPEDCIMKIIGTFKESEKELTNIDAIKKVCQQHCFKLEDIRIDFINEERDNSENQIFTPLLSEVQALEKWVEINKLDNNTLEKGRQIINEYDNKEEK